MHILDPFLRMLQELPAMRSSLPFLYVGFVSTEALPNSKVHDPPRPQLKKMELSRHISLMRRVVRTFTLAQTDSQSQASSADLGLTIESIGGRGACKLVVREPGTSESEEVTIGLQGVICASFLPPFAANTG